MLSTSVRIWRDGHFKRAQTDHSSLAPRPQTVRVLVAYASFEEIRASPLRDSLEAQSLQHADGSRVARIHFRRDGAHAVVVYQQPKNTLARLGCISLSPEIRGQDIRYVRGSALRHRRLHASGVFQRGLAGHGQLSQASSPAGERRLSNL